MNKLVIQILGMFILLLGSFFFSSAETALTTANVIKLRALADEGDKRAKTFCKLNDSHAKTLSTILIGNNIVNIGASSLSTVIAIDIFGNYGAGIATGILTILILVFGEISPKNIAVANANTLALRYAPIIYKLSIILTPVIFCINAISKGFVRLLGVKIDNTEEAITPEELAIIVDDGVAAGTIETDEQKLIHNVFSLSDTKVADIMTPRNDIVAVSIDSTLEDIKKVFSEEMFTRIPVYSGKRDNIVGILNAKDLICAELNNKGFNLKKLMRGVTFTIEQKDVGDLLREFQRTRNQVAIVIDEYGLVSGLVTVEDIVEELVGEIRDEYDADEVLPIKKIDENRYNILGDVSVKKCSNLFIVPDDYKSHTVGGYITEMIGKIPKRGESVKDFDGNTFTVIESDKRRVLKVQLLINKD